MINCGNVTCQDCVLNAIDEYKGTEGCVSNYDSKQDLYESMQEFWNHINKKEEEK